MNKSIIIKRPLITEKSLKDASVGVFTFEVLKSCDKKQAKKEIEKMFNVHVVRIATSIKKGKVHTVGKKRNVVRKPDIKKVFVKLKTGEKIDLFEVGQAK
jgi:large subunit ribosomal protein L23